MITIEKAGLLTTVQDLGRYGYQKFGVVVSGAMDTYSHRVANLLVGNEENAATLEITLLGPSIVFDEDALISICGGDLTPTINGLPVRMGRSIFVKKDSILSFGTCKAGCRAYLAVAGGFSVPTILNSKSTYLRAKIGGYKGRALKTGDVLEVDTPCVLSKKIIHSLRNRLSSGTFLEENWFFPSMKYGKIFQIRLLKGRQFDLFTSDSQEKVFKESYQIQAESDRMGYRLNGPYLSLKFSKELISEAVNFGTIQVPSDGNPIILMADRQTTGGYPKIGQVAMVDLPLIAQAKPGDHLRFSEVSLLKAQQLFLERKRVIELLKIGIRFKYLK